ncbi:MAG: helix-turn-helix domain-containing protein [Defluviitaleaceae bacterium]|nr:helix-turn-helix domain-containing protein [Defluviitaleaceae bacterium]MCL2836919.1 helix-turn-helix domain-containing protein [Defluviitaleaceae bacterium]
MWEQRAIGERICQIRKERNLSRAEFGKLTGLSKHYIGNIERGKHSITGAAIASICTAVGVSADYIIFGNIDPTSVIEALYGITREQIQVTLEISMKVAKFLSTKNGNNALIQEAFRRQQPASL